MDEGYAPLPAPAYGQLGCCRSDFPGKKEKKIFKILQTLAYKIKLFSPLLMEQHISCISIYYRGRL
jgi:hypothetical protein